MNISSPALEVLPPVTPDKGPSRYQSGKCSPTTASATLQSRAWPTDRVGPRRSRSGKGLRAIAVHNPLSSIPDDIAPTIRAKPAVVNGDPHSLTKTKGDGRLSR
jgi:hypothetical protein